MQELHDGARVLVLAAFSLPVEALVYAKVFSSLWCGTLYGKTDAQLVFIFLLAHADADGEVRVVPEAIAGPTGLTLEQVSSALSLLEAPDIESGSPEQSGARLERVGNAARWQITNYLKYRGLRDEDQRRKQNRESQQRFREKPKPPSAEISHCQPPSAQGEAEEEVEARVSPPSPLRLPSSALRA